ncbi:Ankyrin repeat-containing protein BDA1 [Cardamine amara subsp. amara]|uniref:Ankyrin repeat-containing protein BDA1 n=1 Tax=Cardamine amara subsp. amara TaxID=228776 RepID=A0ABD0ZVM3_CARAN
MDPRLLLVAHSGSVDALYSLIQKDPYILHNIDVSPFIHTPLHEASYTGKIDLAMELMILKPSIAKKLNADGFSPLHLAVETHQVELALELVKFDPSLVRIPGRGGMTPLHLVVKKVINDRYDELKILRGWLQRVRKSDASSTEIQVLNRRDREGNTALHLAAYKNNHQAVKQLLKCMSLNRNIQNKSGMTALNALQVNGSNMNRETEKIIQKAGGKSASTSQFKVKKTSDFLRKPVTFWEYCSTGMARYRSRMSDGTRNSLLVITALIITATYQTAAQPQDSNDQENLVGRAYTWWYIFISAPLVCSYAISVYLKFSAALIFLFMYLIVVFGLLIYLLVFYVKWKRTTRKKVPTPKSELISEGLKIMV